MSPLHAFLAVVAVLAVSGAGTWVLVRRARQHESAKDRVIRAIHENAARAAVSDPKTLAVAGVEAQVKAVLVGHVLDHPDVADGFARLDRAIREGGAQ